jgi:hypothetical protein
MITNYPKNDVGWSPLHSWGVTVYAQHTDFKQPLDGHDQLRQTHGVMSLGRALETALHAAEKSKGGVKRSLAAWIPWIHVDTRFFALPKFPNDSTNDCLADLMVSCYILEVPG